MGQRYLIDTSALSKYIVGELSVSSMKVMSSLTESNISVISQIELLSWKTSPIIENAVIESIEVSNILHVSEPIIKKTIEIRRKAKVKLPDALIAATAIIHGLTLLSTNDKDFIKIPRLKCQSLN